MSPERYFRQVEKYIAKTPGSWRGYVTVRELAEAIPLAGFDLRGSQTVFGHALKWAGWKCKHVHVCDDGPSRRERRYYPPVPGAEPQTQVPRTAPPLPPPITATLK